MRPLVRDYLLPSRLVGILSLFFATFLIASGVQAQNLQTGGATQPDPGAPQGVRATTLVSRSSFEHGPNRNLGADTDARRWNSFFGRSAGRNLQERPEFIPAEHHWHSKDWQGWNSAGNDDLPHNDFPHNEFNGRHNGGRRPGMNRRSNLVDQAQLPGFYPPVNNFQGDRSARLGQQILDGVSNARLTHNEAERLLSNLGRVETLQRQLQRENVTMPPFERMRLHRELQRLAARLSQELQDNRISQ